MNNFYQLTATNIQGKSFDFAQLQGKAVLIVNTASQCGFTPQYAGLEQLYQRYKNQGLVVLGFPCNQFGGQEPKGEASIAEFCELNYGVTFPMMAKVDVNGDNTHPVYQFLKTQPNGDGLLGNKIKWNFTKFLVSPQGEVVKRYAPMAKPMDIAEDIEQVIA
ncbi:MULTISPECIES: glutathione peroxidase [unclassified Moraxella]|uniref:glutathione peroxidase n=1 Tax=unclassified Moraxella TaxID=2685852 RepID=UPI003AF75A72